jgi:uncharacterized membrane protein YkvA (DUF1232 family)
VRLFAGKFLPEKALLCFYVCDAANIAIHSHNYYISPVKAPPSPVLAAIGWISKVFVVSAMILLVVSRHWVE